MPAMTMLRVPRFVRPINFRVYIGETYMSSTNRFDTNDVARGFESAVECNAPFALIEDDRYNGRNYITIQKRSRGTYTVEFHRLGSSLGPIRETFAGIDSIEVAALVAYDLLTSK
jgi:hypothetical protein